MSLLNWAEQYHDAANILAYQFDYAPPGPPEGFGSFHSAEIPYVFGQLDAGDRQYSGADKALSELLQNQWLAFIKSGKDKVTAGDDWPALASGQLLVVGKKGNASTEPVLSKEKIQLFEEASAAGGTLGMFSAEVFH
ncbi:carboxylesterase family protein [Alteromonas sp. NFXS44]